MSYLANSNLVLANNRRGKRAQDDGSAKSLREESVQNLKMGDMVRQSKPNDGKPSKAKKPKKTTDMDLGVLTGQGFNLDGAPSLYRPKTKETRAAFEALLSSIKGVLTEAPHDVLCGAADEILLVLKNDGMRDPERQKEISKMLGDTISNEKYTHFVAIGKLITDFSAEENDDTGGDALDEELGVAVEFEDEDEEDEDAMVQTEVVDDGEFDDDDEEDGMEDRMEDGVRNKEAIVDRDGLADGEAGTGAAAGVPNAKAVDAFWLQRRISEAYEDTVRLTVGMRLDTVALARYRPTLALAH
jgi:pre-mRNA-splicing helicase BRR2